MYILFIVCFLFIQVYLTKIHSFGQHVVLSLCVQSQWQLVSALSNSVPLDNLAQSMLVISESTRTRRQGNQGKADNVGVNLHIDIQ